MIEKIQRLINQDIVHNKNIGNLIAWINKQDKLIRKYPRNRRSGIINNLLSVDRGIMTKEQIDALIEEIEGKKANSDVIQAFQENKTTDEIAQMFNVSTYTVKQWRRLSGYSKPPTKKFSDEDFLKAYYEGKTPQQMADMFEVSLPTISKKKKRLLS